MTPFADHRESCGFAGRAANKSWLGHPRGVWLVSFTELWERFSFYGISSIFVLFLSGASVSGGWGWSEESALLFNGWYMGALMMAPLLGGWLTIRHVSERRCIAWGAIFVMIGHLLFLLSHTAPHWTVLFSGTQVDHLFVAPNLELGRLSADAAGEAFRGHRAAGGGAGDDPAGIARAFSMAYWANAGLFYAAIAFLFFGTALIKPAVSSIISGFYREGDPRRSEGFQLLFFGLYLGCTLGITIPGLLGERYGWHMGFSVAGIGMALGLVAYLWFQKDWLGDVGSVPLGSSASAPAEDRGIRRDRLRAYLVHGAFTIVYMAIFYQVIGLLSLYIRDHVDRNFLGFDIPTTWIQNVSVILFLAWTPCISLLTRSLARSARHFGTTMKCTCALIVLGAGFAVLAFATADGRPSLLWFVFAYALFGLGDALLGPAQVALATRLAPAGRRALYASGWFVFVGLGALISGYIGAYSGAYFDISVLLWVLAAVALVAAGIYAALSRKLTLWSRGADMLPDPER